MASSSEPFSELESTAVAGEPSSSMSTTFEMTMNATRMELERRQLHHTIQLLKLELSQKQLLVESLEAEHASRVEELQEQLEDAECEKKLLQHRLQAVTQMHEEEVRQFRVLRDSQSLASDYQHVSQPSCGGAPVITDEVRQALQLPVVSEEDYHELQCKGSRMTLHEYAQVRVHEMVRPFMKETADLREEVVHLNAQLEEMEGEKRVLQERANKSEWLQHQCTELQSEVNSLSTHIQQSNFKAAHYDTLKSERDEMEKELDAVRRALVEKEVRQSVVMDERDRWKAELTASEQKIALLQQDKEYLTHQLSEQAQHLQTAQEQARHLQKSLEEVRHSKEELFRQFSRTREDLKKEYDTQLHRELEALRQRTHLEIEQLKLRTRELYEQENRSLRETKDGVCAERNRILSRHKELEEKHEKLVTEHQKVTMDLNSTVSDLQSALKMKSFDYERSQLLHQEATKNLQHCQLEKEKAVKKAELLGQEFQSYKRESEVQVKLLEERLREMTSRVDGYENLEKELDDVVIQAAELDNGPDAERVLLSYGFGTSIPSSSRRRMQQSVHLARRVLKLERINSSLRQQIATTEHSLKRQEEKLASLTEQLDLSKQPYKYLVESLSGRDEELRAARDRIVALEKMVQKLEEENKQMSEVKDQLSSDLETLLNHREEMNIMKQLVVGLQGHMTSTTPMAPPPPPSSVPDPNITNPKPTIFTKKSLPLWHSNPRAKTNSKPS